MTSLQFSAQSLPLLHRPHATGVHKSSVSLTLGKNYAVTHLNFRFKNEGKVLARSRLHPVLGSNTNPSDGSNETKSSDGPPFLTILAGFLVFAFTCWIVGSIVMWIISLILNPPPLK